VDGAHPRATEKNKIVKKINKMTLSLIDQKMTLREQYQRMTMLFINISTKLKYIFKEFKA